ncbi:hypothetical protein J2T12_000643 [Paenibacillus anaericanus]|nr:hypothetical protein [Paenibacillus anaericanus]
MFKYRLALASTCSKLVTSAADHLLDFTTGAHTVNRELV